jgi:outer membrane lipoprotein-sorting protein
MVQPAFQLEFMMVTFFDILLLALILVLGLALSNIREDLDQLSNKLTLLHSTMQDLTSKLSANQESTTGTNQQRSRSGKR